MTHVTDPGPTLLAQCLMTGTRCRTPGSPPCGRRCRCARSPSDPPAVPCPSEPRAGPGVAPTPGPAPGSDGPHPPRGAPGSQPPSWMFGCERAPEAESPPRDDPARVLAWLAATAGEPVGRVRGATAWGGGAGRPTPWPWSSGSSPWGRSWLQEIACRPRPRRCGPSTRRWCCWRSGCRGWTGMKRPRRSGTCGTGRAVVLVALTGWAQEEDRRRTEQAGFDHHLVKPVDHAVVQRLPATLRGS